MPPTLAARLAKVKETPVVPAALLAALEGRGELPADLTGFARALEAEAEAVAELRERLADVPPARAPGESGLL